jgi:hypothetical protein
LKLEHASKKNYYWTDWRQGHVDFYFGLGAKWNFSRKKKVNTMDNKEYADAEFWT